MQGCGKEVARACRSQAPYMPVCSLQAAIKKVRPANCWQESREIVAAPRRTVRLASQASTCDFKSRAPWSLRHNNLEEMKFLCTILLLSAAYFVRGGGEPSACESLLLTRAPVCGADGITYLNRQIAE